MASLEKKNVVHMWLISILDIPVGYFLIKIGYKV